MGKYLKRVTHYALVLALTLTLCVMITTMHLAALAPKDKSLMSRSKPVSILIAAQVKINHSRINNYFWIFVGRNPCNLGQYIGPCNSQILRFLYNATSQKCEKFFMVVVLLMRTISSHFMTVKKNVVVSSNNWVQFLWLLSNQTALLPAHWNSVLSKKKQCVQCELLSSLKCNNI